MRFFYFFILIAVVLTGCKNTTPNIVDDSFISITYQYDRKLESMPISELVESLEIIPLDNADEAFMRPWLVVLSENYVIIEGSYMETSKLFTKQGEFICDIGGIGQGPGEYNNIYNSFIDEKKERVYLAPFPTKKILAYNLKGEFINDECIPLAYDSPKSAFYLDSNKKKLLVFSLSFDRFAIPVCWIQDLEGNVIQSILSDNYNVTTDYSNEINSSHNTHNYDVQFDQFFKKKQDTLYHYDITRNLLVPKFSVYDPHLEREHTFMYIDLPFFYCTMVRIIQENAYRNSDVGDRFYILVDKETNEERYVRFKNDYLGGIPILLENDKIWFRDGYMTMIIEPATLKELFEERLQEEDLTEEDRRVIEEFDSRISENDNCILMYGKLKQ